MLSSSPIRLEKPSLKLEDNLDFSWRWLGFRTDIGGGSVAGVSDRKWPEVGDTLMQYNPRRAKVHHKRGPFSLPTSIARG
jgi:hypothetical protein